MKELRFNDLANFGINPRQLEADNMLFQDDCKYLLYGGAAHGGKSYFLRWEALKLALYYSQKYKIRGVPVGLFSEDYPTLKDRQIAKIKYEFPPWLGELKDTKHEGYVFKIADKYGGGRILLRNLDDPSKYASVEFAAVVVEELTKNKRDVFDNLRFRMRYPGIKDVKFLAATNPGQIGHGWVKKLWVSPDPNDLDNEQNLFKFIQSLPADNPLTSEEYIQQLESLPERMRKALLEGNWDIFEGQYFTEFNRNIHVCKPFTPKSTLIKAGGMDWGRTAPFAFLGSVVQNVKMKDGRQFNRVFTYNEVYGTEKNPKEWARIIDKQVKLDEYKQIMGDPAIFKKKEDGSRSIADDFNDTWKKNGYKLQPANNDRLSGWAIMHDWLSIAPDGLPYWMITENCSNLIRTLPELVHDELKVEDVDTHGEDHAPDAARYMLKHLKWIDAKVGGTGKPERRTVLRPRRAPITKIDLNAFAKVQDKSSKDWRAI